MTISRIESLVYGIEDMGAGIRYFEDWGLECLERSADGAHFATAAGQSVVLKMATDASLPDAIEGGPTLREVIWGVDDAADLRRIGVELGRDREVKKGANSTLHTRDDVGFAIGFRRVGPPLKGAVGRKNAAGASRMNRPFDPERRARPRKIGHVVYSIRRNDIEKASDFYLKRLNFRLSDRALDLGDFMRCAGTTDHHSLFFLTRPDRAAFDHVAFEVRDIDEIILGGKYMKERGWVANTPVGRHILGSNLFWYFVNPCGGRTEYYADMDLMDKNWKPRVWEQSPGYAMWMLEKTDSPEITRG